MRVRVRVLRGFGGEEARDHLLLRFPHWRGGVESSSAGNKVAKRGRGYL